MTLADLGKPKIIVVQVAVVLAIAGGVWGYSAWSGDASSAANAVPPELTVEALKTQMDDPGKLMQTVRQTMRRDDLTDEQRSEVRRNMREVWQSTMDERVDKYFAAATEKDKNVVLDRQIDEFQERMKGWEARRREREQEREARGRDGDADGQQTTESRDERRSRDMVRTPRHRSTRSFSLTPGAVKGLLSLSSGVTCLTSLMFSGGRDGSRPSDVLVRQPRRRRAKKCARRYSNRFLIWPRFALRVG
ncbi:MAG: hypothetical protein IID43_04940 [Planctomycetes bacterium]|nr:hypothetical protein [Planctomycetota bacterium]